MSKAAEAFRTISEVANDLEVPKHVLRFWEVKFPQIRPMKRGGGRRYYRPEDLELLRGIRHLLHAEGYTIKGVQKILREQGIDHVKVYGRDDGEAPSGTQDAEPATRKKAKAAASAAPPARAKAPGRQRGGKDRPLTRAEQIAAAIAELEACRGLLVSATAAPQAARPPRARAARS